MGTDDRLRELAAALGDGGERALEAQREASRLLARRTRPLPADRRAPHPLILLWTAPAWGPAAGFHDGPPRFEITCDRGRYREAWAIVFLLPTLAAGLPILPRVERQAWIGWALESETIYPQILDPAVRGALDGMLSHRRDSEFPWPYVHAPHLEELRRAPVAKTEAAPAVWVVSSRLATSGRAALVQELERHFPIDRYGRYRPNRRFEPPDLGRETKLRTIARYHFTLALENSISPDYVTEKLFDALVAGSVPIYLGTDDVRDFLPAEGCALLVRDFPSAAALAERVLELCRDEAAYGELLAWKQRPFRPEFVALVERWAEDPFARIARRLAAAVPTLG